MTTSCEPFRELLALRLFDELDADEAPRLDEHLASCEACRAFEGELALGLGRYAGANTATNEVHDDLPDGWRDALHRTIATAPRPLVGAAPTARAALARTALTFASGLAAGLLLVLTVRDAPPSPKDDAPRAAIPGDESRLAEANGFALDAPPPRATSRGELARLAALMRQ